MPYGYALDDFTFNDRRMRRNSQHLSLDADNSRGATYGGVIAAAMNELVKALRRDEVFDIICWREGGKYPGYKGIRVVGEDAKVRTVR